MFGSEICYVLEYVEENGRSRGDPWSLRQTGVYQQVSLKPRQSVWITLQPSKSTRECVERALQGKHMELYGPENNPMLLHTLFLMTTADNWMGYVKYLHCQLQGLVRKASLIL